jgi:sugar phosphate isomerase/epimerase
MHRRAVIQSGLALAASTLISTRARAAASTRRPDSLIRGVQIGVISYSFRSMPDQSATAILDYCRQIGLSAIELMGEPAEEYAGIPVRFDLGRMFRVNNPNQPQTEQLRREREQLSEEYAAYRHAAAQWRPTASMAPFVRLGELYRRAGVPIYAFKPSTFDRDNTDAEVDYGMRAARALGGNHVTVEMPTEPQQIARLAAAASRHGLRVAYHEHLQATPTLWDAALSESPANAINLDLGHYVAADDYDALALIRAHHDRIASMHLKDRRTHSHGGANLPWGEGDTPIVGALRLMRDRSYRFPAAIELEYPIPAGSDAVKEVARCLEYCRRALT